MDVTKPIISLLPAIFIKENVEIISQGNVELICSYSNHSSPPKDRDEIISTFTINLFPINVIFSLHPYFNTVSFTRFTCTRVYYTSFLTYLISSFSLWHPLKTSYLNSPLLIYCNYYWFITQRHWYF